MAPEKVTVEITPCQDVPEEGATVDVSVRISIPDGDHEKRQPTDFVCLIDTSGSMSVSAINRNCDPDTKDEGYSVLDIVKHAVNSVMDMLSPQDRVAVVAFHSMDELVFPLTLMDVNGKKRSREILAPFKARGATNLWAGIHRSMEILRTDEMPGSRKKSILLLTDGIPNRAPPTGYIPDIRNYMDQHPKFKFQMNTFGFGYQLQSQLLLELASECNGTYSFIPVAPNVGTVFVNTVSNVLSNFTQSATLKLAPAPGATFTGPVGADLDSSDEAWGKYIYLGPLQHG